MGDALRRLKKEGVSSVYLGTSVADCWAIIELAAAGEVVAVSAEVGTTWASSSLYECACAEEVLINHQIEPPLDVPVETNLQLLRPKDPLVHYVSRLFAWQKVFIPIYQVVLQDGRRTVKMPNSREEIAMSSSIPTEDKLALYHCMTNGFAENFSELSEPTKTMLLSALAGTTSMSAEAVLNVQSHFGHLGGPQYLFPAKTFSAISWLLLQSHPSIHYAPTVDLPDPSKRTPPFILNIAGLGEITARQVLESPKNYKQYLRILLLKRPFTSTPTKHTFLIDQNHIHGLSITLKSINYLYLWSDKTVPGTIIRSVGLNPESLLFHAELVSNSSNSWCSFDI
ncbi:hypothetical protein NEHOM01_0940 [Nematocida homosporus]|uniref:uncharacterized protein n=1 Tax=Nematocida homosporus TaxID=1912981 RepID=UPI00221F0EB2|nr:uncharacterized protein NEHOM01_0940 [Nematocida homosporus]KAI5185614.1 hypothetical protein NEHOM01_0940 [Nematocida homosporus]